MTTPDLNARDARTLWLAEQMADAACATEAGEFISRQRAALIAHLSAEPSASAPAAQPAVQGAAARMNRHTGMWEGPEEYPEEVEVLGILHEDPDVVTDKVLEVVARLCAERDDALRKTQDIAASPQPASEPAQPLAQPCAGMRCGSLDATTHSPQCEAEHAARIAGGTFVPWGRPAQAEAGDAGWVSVTERLPEKGVECLVYWGEAWGQPLIGIAAIRQSYGLRGEWLWHGHPGSHNDVQRWHALPARPSATADAGREPKESGNG